MTRTRAQIEALYATKPIDDDTLKQIVIDRLGKDGHFARRCLLLLWEEQLQGYDLVKLYGMLNGAQKLEKQG